MKIAKILAPKDTKRKRAYLLFFFFSFINHVDFGHNKSLKNFNYISA